MSQIDKRIQVNTIIENQLPEFVVSDFPNAIEFLSNIIFLKNFKVEQVILSIILITILKLIL